MLLLVGCEADDNLIETAPESIAPEVSTFQLARNNVECFNTAWSASCDSNDFKFPGSTYFARRLNDFIYESRFVVLLPSSCSNRPINVSAIWTGIIPSPSLFPTLSGVHKVYEQGNADFSIRISLLGDNGYTYINSRFDQRTMREIKLDSSSTSQYSYQKRANPCSDELVTLQLDASYNGYVYAYSDYLTIFDSIRIDAIFDNLLKHNEY